MHLYSCCRKKVLHTSSSLHQKTPWVSRLCHSTKASMNVTNVSRSTDVITLISADTFLLDLTREKARFPLHLKIQKKGNNNGIIIGKFKDRSRHSKRLSSFSSVDLTMSGQTIAGRQPREAFLTCFECGTCVHFCYWFLRRTYLLLRMEKYLWSQDSSFNLRSRFLRRHSKDI